MTFYCPGFICASPEKYNEVEKSRGNLPDYPTEEYLLVSTLFCLNDKFMFHHAVGYYPRMNIRDCFRKARELNRKVGMIREFDSYQDFAIDWRHQCRRFAALAVPNRAASQMVPNTTALLRMLAIYLSWPYEIKEPEDSFTSLYRHYMEVYKQHNGEGPQTVHVFPYTGVIELEKMETVYQDLVPTHTRDTIREGGGYEATFREFAFGELLWEKFDKDGSISKQANVPINDRLQRAQF
jgi:hypothetical protein